jgi:hypothetical protein
MSTASLLFDFGAILFSVGFASMFATRQAMNPWYALLLILGILFMFIGNELSIRENKRKKQVEDKMITLLESIDKKLENLNKKLGDKNVKPKRKSSKL